MDNMPLTAHYNLIHQGRFKDFEAAVLRSGFEGDWWDFPLTGEVTILEYLARHGKVKVLKKLLPDLETYQLRWKSGASIVKVLSNYFLSRGHFNDNHINDILHWVAMGVTKWDDRENIFYNILKKTRGRINYERVMSLKERMEELGVDVWVDQGNTVGILVDLANKNTVVELFKLIPNKELLIRSSYLMKKFFALKIEPIVDILIEEGLSDLGLKHLTPSLIQCGAFNEVQKMRDAVSVKIQRNEVVEEINEFCKIGNKSGIKNFLKWVRENQEVYNFTIEERVDWFKKFHERGRLVAAQMLSEEFKIPLSYTEKDNPIPLGLRDLKVTSSLWHMLRQYMKNKEIDWVEKSGGFTEEFAKESLVELVKTEDSEKKIVCDFFESVEKSGVFLDVKNGLFDGGSFDDLLEKIAKSDRYSFRDPSFFDKWRTRMETHYLMMSFRADKPKVRKAL